VQLLTDNKKFAMSVCRLCGEERSPLDLVVELNDKTSGDWSYIELIEYHARVTLETNKLLPQGICDECRLQVDKFVEFSGRLQAVQSIFVTSIPPEEEIRTGENYVLLGNVLGDPVAEPITSVEYVNDATLKDSKVKLKTFSSLSSLKYFHLFILETNNTSTRRSNLLQRYNRFHPQKSAIRCA
jgi:Zinc-finger associated domain (zf-AD)